MTRIAYFVTAHGFGHAARAAAVADALRRRRSGVEVTIVTAVPRWFFDDSLGPSIRIEPIDVDPGLVQTDALNVDLAASVAMLRERIPFREATVDALATVVHRIGAGAVVCDVAPIGLEVARRCSVPSVLVENFTWDWIYRGYVTERPELADIAAYLDPIFASADHHLQVDPVCAASPSAHRVSPVSRPPRASRAEVRRELGIAEDQPFVLLTMGGIGWRSDWLAASRSPGDPWLVVLGDDPPPRTTGVIRLPHRSAFFHPDLIHAADVVVAKLGYSTLAEVWSAGAPLAYLSRPGFRESAALECWARRHLTCRRLSLSPVTPRDWWDAVDELRRARRSPPQGHHGAMEVADYLLQKVLS